MSNFVTVKGLEDSLSRIHTRLIDFEKFQHRVSDTIGAVARQVHRLMTRADGGLLDIEKRVAKLECASKRQ
jgi:hypothetical protein